MMRQGDQILNPTGKSKEAPERWPLPSVKKKKAALGVASFLRVRSLSSEGNAEI